MTEATRPYGGVSSDQRRTVRRQRLLDAGIEVMGSAGAAETSIRAVLRTSGVGERYFYESFPDLATFRIAVYESVLNDVLARVVMALASAPDDLETQIRVGLREFAVATTADPARARIQLLEVFAGGPELLARGRAVLREFAALIAGRMPEPVRANARLEILALALSGAVHETLSEWVLGTVSTDLDELVEHWIALFDAVKHWLIDGAASA